MHWIDYFIWTVYMMLVMAVGFYHYRRNRHIEDYYVGNRSMKAGHIGFSIVATDVGGGFSIGLGGVGFLMGLSGSWLLFTGLLGAWLSAVFIIPKVKTIDKDHAMLTFPDFLHKRYNQKVALIAAVVSAIGYMGFTGGQILAGAKLASVTLFPRPPLDIPPLQFSLALIALITIIYTAFGGLKAVIYTDTVQWIVLLGGLLLVTLPIALSRVGGWSGLKQALPPTHFSLSNISVATALNWLFTIVPIWLIGMTLYQRMYACRDVRDARKAWYLAGFLEYPVMAFTGVILGMCARVLFPAAESELAIPLMIQSSLPVGVTGLVVAAYFSAIMSTADSCLMASSGNVVNDLLMPLSKNRLSVSKQLRLSIWITLTIGITAFILASQFQNVLDVILAAYGFMVSALFVPTLGAFFWKRGSSFAALWSIIGGGSATLALQFGWLELPQEMAQIGLESSVWGMAVSAMIYIAFSFRPGREIK